MTLGPQKKTIRAIDGREYQMVTFNGIDWVLEDRAEEEKLRLHRAGQLHEGRLARQQEEFEARFRPSLTEMAWKGLIRMTRYERPTSRKKGKSGETPSGKHLAPGLPLRRNLQKRPPTFRVPQEEAVLKGSMPHFHRCPICGRKLVCGCDQPWKKQNKLCGGRICATAKETEDIAREKDRARMAFDFGAFALWRAYQWKNNNERKK